MLYTNSSRIIVGIVCSVLTPYMLNLRHGTGAISPVSSGAACAFCVWCTPIFVSRSRLAVLLLNSTFNSNRAHQPANSVPQMLMCLPTTSTRTSSASTSTKLTSHILINPSESRQRRCFDRLTHCIHLGWLHGKN